MAVKTKDGEKNCPKSKKEGKKRRKKEKKIQCKCLRDLKKN